MKNGKLPKDIALEIKREWNTLWQNTFTKKSQIQKNSEKAESWGNMMTNVNKLFDEKLDIWEAIREGDKKLTSYYSIRNNLIELRRKAADLEKKMLNDWWDKKLWRWLYKWINRLTWWWAWFIMKAWLSFLQWAMEKEVFKWDTSNALEIRQSLPKFVKEYSELVDKIEKNPTKEWLIKQAITNFENKWSYLAEPYSDKEEEK
jgi:hypothetical protein